MDKVVFTRISVVVAPMVEKLILRLGGGDPMKVYTWLGILSGFQGVLNFFTLPETHPPEKRISMAKFREAHEKFLPESYSRKRAPSNLRLGNLELCVGKGYKISNYVWGET